MSTSDNLPQRLSFIGLDTAALGHIRNAQADIVKAMPHALDTFYGKLKATPETARFFNSQSHVDSAKARQVGHWERIAKGSFDQGYVSAVTTVGQVHARIGLEPRWYIGGYALILEQVITRVLEDRWPQGRFGKKVPGSTERAAEISAIVKAALLDMDFAISVYLEASVTARLKIENEAKAVEQAKTIEREKAVAYVTSAMAAVADGDLTHRMPDDMPSEYAMICDHFNGAMSRLQEMISTIKSTSGLIATSSREINSGATDLSQRTEQQAAALEETAATTEQLAASVKTSTQMSRQSVGLANNAAKVAQTGGQIVSEAITAMERIEDASKKISEITTVIDGIAFQTNLLALNAAVEAARAGDAGRGFAVVAAEVRALAQRSAGAAKDITGLIASADEYVTEGVKLVRLAGNSLREIVEASDKVSTTVSDISSASGEQANGIDEMAQTVSNMDEITQQNAALAEQSAASAASLTEQINRLDSLISHFKTDDLHRQVARLNATVTAGRPLASGSGSRSTAAAPARKAASGGGWQEF